MADVMTKKIAIPLGLAALFLFSNSPVTRAHGINGHIWVTSGGVDTMRNCEVATWLASEPLRPILQIGASFPDSGYALDQGRDYGETAHWEPFVQAYIDYMRANYGAPYESEEARKRVAFLFGLAAHGAQDEIFDTIFLRKSLQEEGTDQDILDPGTDFMLIAEGHTRMRPDIYLPIDDLKKIFRDPAIDLEVTEDMMNAGMLVVRLAVISLATEESEQLDDEYRPKMPWTQHHYLDPDEPGSLAYEKKVMGPYYDAMWNRLNGVFRSEDVLIYAAPATDYRTATTDHTKVDSWINLMFGYGVLNGSMNDTVKLLDSEGNAVEVELHYTRWGGPGDFGRMAQLRPKADLASNANYTVVLLPGLELVDGTRLKEKITYPFQTACAPGACAAAAPREPAAPACDLDAAPVSAPAKPTARGCAAGGAGELAWFVLSLPLLSRLRRRARRP